MKRSTEDNIRKFMLWVSGILYLVAVVFIAAQAPPLAELLFICVLSGGLSAFILWVIGLINITKED